jgi:hypothetical protein
MTSEFDSRTLPAAIHHSQLLVSGIAKPTHDEDIPRGVQCTGDFKADRRPASGQCEHHEEFAAVTRAVFACAWQLPCSNISPNSMVRPRYLLLPWSIRAGGDSDYGRTDRSCGDA